MTEYDHASLGAVCAAIVKGLSEHGLSHRWETLQSGENIKVICHVTHAAGHTESTALHSLSDTSGGKNDIQALASAVTYLQRYTLLAATGLAVEDGSDDDARRAGGKVEELVTREQAANIEALITEVKADRPRFLAWLDVASIEKIPAAKYADAVRMLEQKRGRS